MIRGLYTAGAGMMVNTQRMQNIDDNIENLRTPGFLEVSEHRLSFPQHLARRIDHPDGIPRSTALGVMGTGAYVADMAYKMSPGLMRETGNRTDMAINGDGFFVLSTPAGQTYTRNGHFMRDPSGYLRSVGGNPVLGVGDRPIGPVPEDFTVTTDGRIIDNTTGAELGQLKIVAVQLDTLVRVGSTTMYTSSAPAAEMMGDRPRIEQGLVEESNVDIAGQMVKMIETNRAFSMNQRAVQSNDQILQRTVNEVGRII